MNTFVIFKRKVKMWIKQLLLATGVQQRQFSCKTYLFQRLLLSLKISKLFLQCCHLEFQLLPALLFTFASGLCLLRGFLELWDVTAERLSCRTRATACSIASWKLLQSCILWSPNPTHKHFPSVLSVIPSLTSHRFIKPYSNIGTNPYKTDKFQAVKDHLKNISLPQFHCSHCLSMLGRPVWYWSSPFSLAR